MASRLISKLRGIKIKHTGDSSIPVATAELELHDHDLEELGEVNPDDVLWADLMNKSGKIAVGAASVENTYTAAAYVETVKKYGIEEAGEMWKSKLGVSGNESSLGDVEKILKETLKDLGYYDSNFKVKVDKSEENVSGDDESEDSESEEDEESNNEDGDDEDGDDEDGDESDESDDEEGDGEESESDNSDESDENDSDDDEDDESEDSGSEDDDNHNEYDFGFDF